MDGDGSFGRSEEKPPDPADEAYAMRVVRHDNLPPVTLEMDLIHPITLIHTPDQQGIGAKIGSAFDHFSR
ncbi:hypothetical protein SAMN02927924_02417 [Sphingobium faniae]|nr:hypothetical protein SAMN02927924_02417 [Sphingobium faniae]